jgi:DNA-binding XRE family transcriptional regulator
MAIKNKLLELRLQMGFNRQQLFADFLGIDRWLYNRYENNKVQPNSENLLIICQKTGKRIEEIIYKVPKE